MSLARLCPRGECRWPTAVGTHKRGATIPAAAAMGVTTTAAAAAATPTTM